MVSLSGGGGFSCYLLHVVDDGLLQVAILGRLGHLGDEAGFVVSLRCGGGCRCGLEDRVDDSSNQVAQRHARRRRAQGTGLVTCVLGADLECQCQSSTRQVSANSDTRAS